MATTPNTAKLTGSVTWSDGSPFDGWLLLGLVLPENADGQWPTTVLNGATIQQRLPLWAKIPITAGAFDSQTSILYNTSVEPPASRYVAYWYDKNHRRIFPATGVPPTPFTISANPYAIALPTLTAPSNSATLPVPTETTLGV